MKGKAPAKQQTRKLVDVNSSPLPTLLARTRQRMPATSNQTDLLVFVKDACPGYVWGISVHENGQEPVRWGGGEAGSLLNLEESIKGSIVSAQKSHPSSVLVVDTAGDLEVWREIALRLPAGARMKDPREKTIFDPRPFWKANSICPGMVSGLDVDIATDGSVGKRTGHAGYGWISSDGAFGVGMLGVTHDVCHAELAAIRSAMKRVTKSSRVTLLVDSMEAINLVTRQIEVGTAGISTTRRRQSLLAEIDRSPIRRAEIEKVQAHNGHILNEGADRLAKLGRRASEIGLSKERVWETAIHIRTEVIEDLRADRA